MPEAEWFKAFLQLGGVAVLGWLIWFLFTKWMPARDAEHCSAMAAQREDFRAEMAQERATTASIKTAFEAALQLVSDRHKDQMQAMWIRIDEMTRQRDKRDEKITEVLNKLLEK